MKNLLKTYYMYMKTLFYLIPRIRYLILAVKGQNNRLIRGGGQGGRGYGGGGCGIGGGGCGIRGGGGGKRVERGREAGIEGAGSLER